MPHADTGGTGSMSDAKIIYVVAPTGAAGGGMGRVKDYMLASGGDAAGRFTFRPLVTRDDRGAAFSLLLLAKAVLAIWSVALRGKLAFVHVHFGDKGSAARKGLIVLASRIALVPVVLHLHAAELIGFHAEGSALRKAAIRLPFRAANVVIVLGKLWKDWLAQDLGIDPGKIDILYNGVPVEPMPRRFEPGNPRTLLFLGQLMERKGTHDLIRALALLPEEAGDWRAVFAGNGDIPFYRGLAAELGIASRVTFTGWVDQNGVREWLARSDMMALPSYNEGIPLVILEALGAGTPVICTPVGAIPEVLEEGRDVLFVPPGDHAALAHAITRLMTDHTLLQRLSDEGIARFRRQFALDVFIANLFAIYRRRFGLAMEPARRVGPAGLRHV
jgi:glycosyltransferase involved in cell wall biosynthesis